MSREPIPPGEAEADAVGGADVDSMPPVRELPPEGLRLRTARGAMINTAFRIGLAGVGLFRNIAIAAFLTRDEYGLWALVLVTLIGLAFLKQLGISQKYLQQNEPDQKLAFQRAFTMNLTYSMAFLVVIAAVLPVYAVIYGQPDMLGPSFALSAILVIQVFQSPVLVFYRRMEYFKQRVLESIDPLVSAAVMIGLAAAGLGYWGLVIGALTGTTLAAAAAVIASPYPLAWRFDRESFREYVGFSWPLFVNGIGALIVVQGTLIVGEAALGLAAVGAIGLATNFARFSTQVDQLINRTLYPAICAVQDRLETLYEVFVKSNRIGLMWAVPFGACLALFAGDLISFVLGEKWRSAQLLLEVAGINFAINTFGLAWASLYSARNNTRPIAVHGMVAVGAFFAIVTPLILTAGLAGFAIGRAATAVLQLGVRSYYLRRLFESFSMVRHLVRAVAPVVPGVLLVLAARALVETGDRVPWMAVVELGVFGVTTIVATYLSERRLIGEAVGYLRRAVRSGAPAPATG